MLPLALTLALLGDPSAKLADQYAHAIVELNESHARKPLAKSEPDLAKSLPPTARRALDKLLASKDSPELFDSLATAGESALDLDLIDDFEKLRTRLSSSPVHLSRFGIALSRPRFLLRGLDGVEPELLARFADVLDLVLDAYAELYGPLEWSKVPGKKLRVRVHLVDKIERPPHFAPELPFHSEIDFPVVDARALRSPTSDGKFLFYGLCHELGHVLAMWGDPKNEEDHHAWAHYTGVAIVEHLAAREPRPAALEGLEDARWRSLAQERERLAAQAPSTEDRDGVLALFLALHELVGPRKIGDALRALEPSCARVNRVRYLTFRELREALREGAQGPDEKRAIDALFDSAANARKK